MIEIVAPCFFILKFVSPIKNKVRERPNPYYIRVVKSIMIPTLCSCNRVRTNTNNIAGTNKAKLKILNQRVILRCSFRRCTRCQNELHLPDCKSGCHLSSLDLY